MFLLRLRSLAAVAAAILVFPALAGAQTGPADGRRPWTEVQPPVLKSAGASASAPQKVTLVFDLVTGTDGADKAVVEFWGTSDKVIETRTLGKSKNDTKTVEFTPPGSGTYRFKVTAFRNGSPDPKELVTDNFRFTLPLGAPVPGARNLGAGNLKVTWKTVAEADSYTLMWKEGPAGDAGSLEVGQATSADIGPLATGRPYSLTVTAHRGSETSPSVPVTKLVKADPEREWNATWFGQSSKGEVNTVQVLDADNLRLKLNSCTVLPNGSVDLKGGKFTTFHDGITFYYTVIDPKTENFDLTATFTVDDINPIPDGQEGFGLLVMDSLGANGVNMVNHYTNSAGIIATKFETTIDGVKKTGKDTLGARFVSGITPRVLGLGDTGIAQFGVNTSTAFSYETADLVRQGGVYVLTLKKTNTGYHAVYRNTAVPGSEPIEYTLYGTDKLAQLDPDHDYLGFAVARGCNVTVSDVKMTVTDPKTDPPAREEPPILVPLAARVEAPAASGSSFYPFLFRANTDGKVTVKASDGRVLVDAVAVKAGEGLDRTFVLGQGQNDFTVRFEADPAYIPAPRTKVTPLSADFVHTVYHRTYPGKTLFVAPNGSSLGLGTPEKPLSLAMALAFVGPGQTIELAGGTYRPQAGITIERGNDGAEKAPKVLRSAPGDRAVLDFSFSSGGMVLWGNWWVVEGIDITATAGNVKGLQVAGSHNIVRDVTTSFCGDTGLQISGASNEGFDLWPAHNLILNCTSWGNCDPAQNNADGFAAKLTCGPGNVFRGCVSFSNIDDGWDLFSKIESGPIGAVVIDSSVAYRNGSLPDGSGNGDGNGFKLGGDGIAVAHVLRNSIAFDNGTSGITSNSDPAVILENNTSFGNKGPNINLYGKGAGQRLFQARNNLSMKGGSGDVYREMPELASPDNYFWNGAQSLNSLGVQVAVDVFVQTDVATVPGRRADGSIDMKGLLVRTDRAPAGVGSTLR